MIDKNELQKLIEAPLEEKCFITDPFPADNGVPQRFQVVKKYDPKLVIPDLCGLCEYPKIRTELDEFLLLFFCRKISQSISVMKSDETNSVLLSVMNLVTLRSI